MSVKQACPPSTRFLKPGDAGQPGTSVCWLGSAGVLVRSRGTKLLIDPVLTADPGEGGCLYSEVDGMRLLQPPPVFPCDLQDVDAVLYTHADEDHMGHRTAQQLGALGLSFHTTGFVARELQKLGIPAAQITAHPARDVFSVGSIQVRMTAASHSWQETMPEQYDWKYTMEDCTGFWLNTPDGTIWDPGDTRLLPEHLAEQPANLVLMDYSDDPYHFGLRDAVRLSERQSPARLLMFHWGTFALDRACYNANPEQVRPLLRQPDRLLVTPMGQWVTL